MMGTLLAGGAFYRAQDYDTGYSNRSMGNIHLALRLAPVSGRGRVGSFFRALKNLAQIQRLATQYLQRQRFFRPVDLPRAIAAF